MRKTIVSLVLLVTCALPAAADELKVMTVGMVGASFQKLATAWGAKTGHAVTLVIPPSALGLVLDAMKTKNADAVLLPMSEMPGQATQFRSGTVHAIGRIPFALGAKLDGAVPRIGNEAEFRTALAGKTVLINDPVTSLNGRMAQTALEGPGFETVTVRPIASSAANLARSDADYVVTVLPEEINQSAVKVLGEVPPALGLRIDFGGGVTAKAAEPALAVQFLAYLTSAEAAAIWKAGGVTVPVP